MFNLYFNDDNLKAFHNLQKIEAKLISAVDYGKIDEAYKAYDEYIYILLNDKHKFFKYSKDKLQSIKYHNFSILVLMSNLVIEKGFSSFSSKAKLQAMISMMDNYNNINEVINLGKIAIKAFSFQSTKASASSYNKYIQSALNYIHENLDKKLSLDDISGHIYMDKCRFCSQFKQVTGYLFSEYINLVRIERAKILLSHTEKDISEIASSLGFGSQGYFSTIFKKNTNLTPSKFRIKYKNIYMSELNILKDMKNGDM